MSRHCFWVASNLTKMVGQSRVEQVFDSRCLRHHWHRECHLRHELADMSSFQSFREHSGEVPMTSFIIVQFTLQLYTGEDRPIHRNFEDCGLHVVACKAFLVVDHHHSQVLFGLETGN